MTGRNSRGQSLVETTLILTAFMGLLLGMTTVGQKLFVRQTLIQRAHEAARWGAVNPYDPQAIRNVVRYGTPTPAPGDIAFLGMPDATVVVGNPGCPGAECRIMVAIPQQGIHSVEPSEETFAMSGATGGGR